MAKFSPSVVDAKGTLPDAMHSDVDGELYAVVFVELPAFFDPVDGAVFCGHQYECVRDGDVSELGMFL